VSTHVVICAHDLPGNFAGGPNSWLLRLIPGLIQRGLQVTTLVIGKGESEECPFVCALRSKGYPLHFLNSGGSGQFLQYRLRWIVAQLNLLKPDVFVPNVTVAAYFATKWIQKAGIPCVGVIHSNDAFHHHLIDSFVLGESGQSVSAVVAVSEHIRKCINARQNSGLTLERIPCGVPVPETIKRVKPAGLRVAYVGRFRQQQKRILDVTKAFCLASKVLPNASFTLLGNGPEKEAIENLILEQNANPLVRIAEPLPPSDILEFMQTQDVIVLLSDYEGMPIALMEAMATGVVPVCLKEDSGISELISHGDNGLVVHDRSADFVAALCRLNDDRALLAQLAASARATIEAGYASGDQHDKWKSLLEKVANIGPKRKIRLPLFLRLPQPHPSFRNEDLHEPTLREECRISMQSKWMNLRQLIRPRARLRKMWQSLKEDTR